MGIYCGIEALVVPDWHAMTFDDLFGRESLGQLPESAPGVGDRRDAERVPLPSWRPDGDRSER